MMLNDIQIILYLLQGKFNVNINIYLKRKRG
jgi:hypothetical protein